MSQRFRYYVRVRYQECDAQHVVFNARYGDYIDLACFEFLRAALPRSRRAPPARRRIMPGFCGRSLERLLEAYSAASMTSRCGCSGASSIMPSACM